MKISKVTGGSWVTNGGGTEMGTWARKAASAAAPLCLPQTLAFSFDLYEHITLPQSHMGRVIPQGKLLWMWAQLSEAKGTARHGAPSAKAAAGGRGWRAVAQGGRGTSTAP